MKQFLVYFFVGVIVWVLFYTFIGNPYDLASSQSGSFFSPKSYREILCTPSASGNVYWDVQASYEPEMRFKLRFLSNGTMSGKIYTWNMIPEQEISGSWQEAGDNIILTYSYNMANMNMYGQVVNWIPSTQNVTLKVTRHSQNYINAVSAGYNTNYSWLFSR